MGSPEDGLVKIELSTDQKDLLHDRNRMPTEVLLSGRKYVLHQVAGDGAKGVVWQCANEMGRKRAVKFVVAADYEHRGVMQEVYRAAPLEGNPAFSRLDDAGVVTITDARAGGQYAYFVEEWIDGITLRQFLKNHPEQVSVPFFLRYVEFMCDALSALRAAELMHDDLHSGNVMLKRPAEGSLSRDWSFKVIDLGSLKSSASLTKKTRTDHVHFVSHLCDLYNALARRRALTRRDSRFLQSTLALIRSMLDDDPASGLREPERIVQAFKAADSRATQADVTPSTGLQNPFEYISAEHLADDSLLVDLFAKSCPWLPKIAGPDPCLVTGPRGCGKSTVFRWLSLRAHLHKPIVSDLPQGIAGFYVSCSSDLQNRLGWIRSQAAADKHHRELIHYFNLTLAREIFSTLVLISERSDAQTSWGLGSNEQKQLLTFIDKWIPGSEPTFQGTTLVRQVLDRIERAMFHCHVEMLRGGHLASPTPETFLGDLTTVMSKNLSFFGSRKIVFLLDDYSTHRLSQPVQVILNRVIWERRGSHIFKLSSERYGAVLNDSSEATSDPSREMVEVDCGREFILISEGQDLRVSERFAEDLLNLRLAAADYSGKARELLGASAWPEGSLARALRSDSKGRGDDHYHGLECIAALCSGDVSTLLLVYRRIFEKGRVTKTSISTVSKALQHQAVQTVSREFLDHIRHHFPDGPAMYGIAQEFGSLVRRILKEGAEIKGNNGKSLFPAQCPRIEVDRLYSSDETLSADGESLARELLRRAVFIEMEPGRSRHSFATSLRWQLRRIYLPAFGAALSKNDAIKWRPGQFKTFLDDAGLACKIEWNNRQKPDGTMSLFSGEDL